MDLILSLLGQCAGTLETVDSLGLKQDFSSSFLPAGQNHAGYHQFPHLATMSKHLMTHRKPSAHLCWLGVQWWNGDQSTSLVTLWQFCLDSKLKESEIRPPEIPSPKGSAFLADMRITYWRSDGGSVFPRNSARSRSLYLFDLEDSIIVTNW